MATYRWQERIFKELAMDKIVELLIKKHVLSTLEPIDNLPCYQISALRALTELLVPLDFQSHKGHFGHVLILEGHPRFAGASRLAALAALRSGAGLVSLLAKDQCFYHPQDRFEFMHLNAHDLKPAHLEKISALVVGPGLSKDPDYQNFALAILKEAMPIVPTIVVDAEALPLLDSLKDFRRSGTIICTPHPKEAASLLQCTTEEIEQDRFRAILNLGALPINQKHAIIWLLKGSSSLVYQASTGIFIFKGNTPMLATGGSGDILAGAIAGLAMQSPSSLSATLLAISLSLAAAYEGSQKADRGIFPSELADRFPSLLKRPVW